MSVAVEVVKPVLLSRDEPDNVKPDVEAIDDNADNAEQQYEEIGEFDNEKKEPPELSARDKIAKNFQDKNRQFGDGSSPNEPDDKKIIEDQENKRTLETEQQDMVSVKINGREILVEQEKIDKAGGLQAYQKEVAVMQGFKDVAYQKKGLDAREADIAEREKKLIEQQTLPTLDETKGQNTSNTSDLPNGDQPQLGDLIAQHREALLDGDDEEADTLMTQMLSIRPTATLDPDDIAEKAANKSISIIQERDRNNAISTAQTDLLTAHPELQTDARLYTAVDDETVSVEREYPHYTPTQILNEAFSRVSEWRGDKAAPANQAVDRINEKRSISRPRVSTARAQAPAQPRRQTKSEYVTALRKSRGLEV